MPQIIELVVLAGNEISTLSMIVVNFKNELIDTRNDQHQLFYTIDSMSTKLQGEVIITADDDNANMSILLCGIITFLLI